MRLHDDPVIPSPAGPMFQTTIKGLLAGIIRQLNAISEGRVAAHHGALTAAPTTGTWQRGDYVKNSAPSATGSPEVVILGWVCVSGGTPGTWKECRSLTGA